jgi:hypothetical protein
MTMTVKNDGCLLDGYEVGSVPIPVGDAGHEQTATAVEEDTPISATVVKLVSGSWNLNNDGSKAIAIDFLSPLPETKPKPPLVLTSTTEYSSSAREIESVMSETSIGSWFFDCDQKEESPSPSLGHCPTMVESPLTVADKTNSKYVALNTDDIEKTPVITNKSTSQPPPEPFLLGSEAGNSEMGVPREATEGEAFMIEPPNKSTVTVAVKDEEVPSVNPMDGQSVTHEEDMGLLMAEGNVAATIGSVSTGAVVIKDEELLPDEDSKETQAGSKDDGDLGLPTGEESAAATVRSDLTDEDLLFADDHQSSQTAREYMSYEQYYLMMDIDPVTRDRYIWNAYYSDLLEYYSIVGHAKIPTNEPEFVRLQQWAKEQRRLYRKRRGFFRKRMLRSERRRKLNKVGFEWNQAKAGDYVLTEEDGEKLVLYIMSM